MKQVQYRYSTSKDLGLCLAILLAFSTSVFAQGDAKAGKALFNSNCAACHNLDRKMTGPMLRNVEQRLADSEGLDRERIYAWVKNSSALIKSGDAYANKIFKEYDNSVMTLFPQLSNADIDNILAYTAQPKEEPKVVVADGSGGEVSSSGGDNTLILIILVFVLLVLVAMLTMVGKTLKNIAEDKGVKVELSKKPLWKVFVENQFLVLVSVIVFVRFFLWNAFMDRHHFL